MFLNDILEWQIVVALRSYLSLTLTASQEELGGSALNEAAVSNGNAGDVFAYELTWLFVRIWQFLPQKSPQQMTDAEADDCRRKLAKLVALLDSLVPMHGLPKVADPSQLQSGPGSRFQHLFSSTEYSRLWALLEHLDATTSRIFLINGPLSPAFNKPTNDLITENIRTVQDVHVIFDLLSRALPETLPENSTPDIVDVAGVGVLDDSIGEYAAAAFHAIFSQLNRCDTAHNAMLYLRSQQDGLSTPKVHLDLFISLCPPRRGWQELQCGEREHLEPDPQGVPNLCQLIMDAKKMGLIIHVVGDEIQNMSQIPLHPRHPRDAPSKSLHSLLLGGVFKPLDIDHPDPNRFTKAQKRELAMDIASSLSRLLGSDWVGDGWCSKDLFFLGKKTDQARSNTPFGPYITCSAGGPPLAQIAPWKPNLGDPSILLLLAKLLLEIDLGTDLDGRIEEALELEPDDNIYLVLFDIYEKYKSDLSYRDAIESCLKYHMTRPLEHKQRKVAVAPGQWSEWDRRYIQGVIKKLADPSIGSPMPGPRSGNRRPQGGSPITMRHISPPIAATQPPGLDNLHERASSAMSRQSSDSGLGASITAPPSSCPPMKPAAPSDQQKLGSIDAAMIDSERRKPTPSKNQAAEAYRPIPADGRDTHPESVPRILQEPLEITPLNVSAWIDGAEKSVAEPDDPSTSRPRSELEMTEEDEVGLVFDEMEFPRFHEHLQEEAERTEQFWAHMREFNKKHFPYVDNNMVTGNTDTVGTDEKPVKRRRVKIALIDTGVDASDPLVMPEVDRGRITGRSWVGEETDISDSCGHGTHIVRLVLKVNKSADILIAKVSKDKSFLPKNTKNIVNNIVEAIQWAVQNDADIISLSLGFKQKIELIDDALDEAINPKIPGAQPRLVFAAAANWGLNKPLAFPANRKGVICVYATTGYGYITETNPRQDKSLRNFPIATLGTVIESEWKREPVWLKGTSFAVPIAAAVAANVLDLARQHLDTEMQRQIERFRGMKAVLALMCAEDDSNPYKYFAPPYNYFAPWLLYQKTVDGKEIRSNQQMIEAIKREIENLEY